MVTRYKAGKNGGGDKGGFKKQVGQEAYRATQEEHADDAVDVEAFHTTTFKLRDLGIQEFRN